MCSSPSLTLSPSLSLPHSPSLPLPPSLAGSIPCTASRELQLWRYLPTAIFFLSILPPRSSPQLPKSALSQSGTPARHRHVWCWNVPGQVLFVLVYVLKCIQLYIIVYMIIYMIVCVCVCVCVCMHIYIFIYMYIYMCVCVYTNTHKMGSSWVCARTALRHR